MDNSVRRIKRQGRLPTQVEHLAAHVILNLVQVEKVGNKSRAYVRFRAVCEEQSLQPMSYATFCRRCAEYADRPALLIRHHRIEADTRANRGEPPSS
jgi:hypothetical protein